MATRWKQDRNRKKIKINNAYFSKFNENMNPHIQESQSTVNKIKTK